MCSADRRPLGWLRRDDVTGGVQVVPHTHWWASKAVTACHQGLADGEHFYLLPDSFDADPHQSPDRTAFREFENKEVDPTVPVRLMYAMRVAAASQPPPPRVRLHTHEHRPGVGVGMKLGVSRSMSEINDDHSNVVIPESGQVVPHTHWWASKAVTACHQGLADGEHFYLLPDSFDADPHQSPDRTAFREFENKEVDPTVPVRLMYAMRVAAASQPPPPRVRLHTHEHRPGVGVGMKLGVSRSMSEINDDHSNVVIPESGLAATRPDVGMGVWHGRHFGSTRDSCGSRGSYGLGQGQDQDYHTRDGDRGSGSDRTDNSSSRHRQSVMLGTTSTSFGIEENNNCNTDDDVNEPSCVPHNEQMAIAHTPWFFRSGHGYDATTTSAGNSNNRCAGNTEGAFVYVPVRGHWRRTFLFP